MTEPWTTEKIREAFIYDGGEAEYHDPINGARDQRRLAGDIFDAWLAAHDAEKRAEWGAEQGEVEWEYGTRCPMPECTEPHLLDESDCPPQPEESLWRRTKARDVPAGEWVPVKENGQTT